MMNPLSRKAPSRAGIAQWLFGLVTWLIARSLQMPEPLVYSTSIFVVAQVQAVENNFARSLCLIRLYRRLLALCRGIR